MKKNIKVMHVIVSLGNGAAGQKAARCQAWACAAQRQCEHHQRGVETREAQAGATRAAVARPPQFLTL